MQAAGRGCGKSREVYSAGNSVRDKNAGKRVKCWVMFVIIMEVGYCIVA